MADYNQIQQKLIAALAARDQAKRELYLQEEKLKQLENQKIRLDRGFDQSRKADITRKEALEKEKGALSESIAKQRKLYIDNRGILENVYQQYHPFSDPRQHMERMNDQHPFMLLPLRIETRFKNVTEDERIFNQLWVRVYPDDVAID